MDNQVKMVHGENRDPQAIQESVSIYQDPLLILDRKEIKEYQESLVLPVKMAILDHKDLKDIAADMHQLANQDILVNQAHLVKMVNQDIQEHLVPRDRKAKPLDWKILKIKSLTASMILNHN